MVGGRTDDLVRYVYSPWSSEPEPHGDRGWICPLCNRVLAPWVRECGCVWSYTAWPLQGRYFTSPYEFETTTVTPYGSGTWVTAFQRQGKIGL